MSTQRHRHRPSVHRAFQQHAFGRFFDAGESDQSGQAGTAAIAWAPRVDIKEEEGRFVIYADLPGVDPQAIEVQMHEGILSIRGERAGTGSDGAGRYAHAERRHGRFHRQFALPDGADAGGIVARSHNGVLEVAIPKKPATVSRRIPVAAVSASEDVANVQPAA
jgi:HSP20 family protein